VRATRDGPVDGAAIDTAVPTADEARLRRTPRAGSLAGRALEYWLRSYRRTWRSSVFSSVLSPLLYLGSLGFGLGTLVDDGSGGGVGVPYALFVAPGVLAANAMQTGVSESTWPVMGAVKWQRQYHAMLAGPLDVVDVFLGHLAFVVLRLVMVSVVFGVIGALLGAFTSWWALAAVAVAVLCGAAYATPVMAFAASQENDANFVYVFRFGLIPTFLFAGTFFPVDQLPELVRPVAYVMPLWHATQSCRDLALGSPDLLAVAGHCGYLLLWAVVGVAAAARTFRRRLVE